MRKDSKSDLKHVLVDGGMTASQVYIYLSIYPSIYLQGIPENLKGGNFIKILNELLLLFNK